MKRTALRVDYCDMIDPTDTTRGVEAPCGCVMRSVEIRTRQESTTQNWQDITIIQTSFWLFKLSNLCIKITATTTNDSLCCDERQWRIRQKVVFLRYNPSESIPRCQVSCTPALSHENSYTTMTRRSSCFIFRGDEMLGTVGWTILHKSRIHAPLTQETTKSVSPPSVLNTSAGSRPHWRNPVSKTDEVWESMS